MFTGTRGGDALRPWDFYRLGKVSKCRQGWLLSLPKYGAMLPLIDGTYREAMVGTLSLVGADREVLHTIYLGDKSEYGKASFNFMMDWEIGKLKAQLGDIPWVGLADGY